jgi:hypothetical protein
MEFTNAYDLFRSTVFYYTLIDFKETHETSQAD